MLFEMTERPALKASRPHRGGMLLRLDEPAIEFYRFLLHSIDLDADDMRLQLADEELFELLQDPLIEVFVLSRGVAPAGLLELDRRVDDEVNWPDSGCSPALVVAVWPSICWRRRSMPPGIRGRIGCGCRSETTAIRGVCCSTNGPGSARTPLAPTRPRCGRFRRLRLPGEARPQLAGGNLRCHHDESSRRVRRRPLGRS